MELDLPLSPLHFGHLIQDGPRGLHCLLTPPLRGEGTTEREGGEEGTYGARGGGVFSGMKGGR